VTVARLLRQQAEILATVRAGDLQRAVALSLEHLSEFPEDTVVRRAIVDHVAKCGDRVLQEQVRELLGDGPA
jgi:DNA-binding GntR family transcriptional regulator